MKIIYVIYLLFTCSAFSQNGKVYETYTTKSDSTDESHGTIFTKPFQEFNYVKTHRGIEVYRTYKSKIDSTNQSHGTIFFKPFPDYIIIDNKMYQTYKSKIDSTNQSHGTIFTKPFESKDIMNIKNINRTEYKINKAGYTKYIEKLPMYNGEGEISYGE